MFPGGSGSLRAILPSSEVCASLPSAFRILTAREMSQDLNPHSAKLTGASLTVVAHEWQASGVSGRTEVLLEAQACGGDRGTSLRLPPVVEHGHLEGLLDPGLGLVVAVLAGNEDGTQRLHGVLSPIADVRISTTDNTEGGRYREDRAHLVLVDDPEYRYN